MSDLPGQVRNHPINSQESAGSSVEGSSKVDEQLDNDITDTIIEPEESYTRKPTAKDLETIILFIDFPDIRVYIGL